MTSSAESPAAASAVSAVANGSVRAPESLGLKATQTRSAILDAAVDRFGRDGMRSSSVAEIARDAGVGGSVVYSYFPNKSALFVAALDRDASALIDEGLSQLIAQPDSRQWRDRLIVTLLSSLERHPLVRRVMAGLEPDVTERVIELPAMIELRAGVVERLRADQAAGIIRRDIDPERIGNGTTTIILTVVMAGMQFGMGAVATYGPDVWAVFDAALDPV